MRLAARLPWKNKGNERSFGVGKEGLVYAPVSPFNLDGVILTIHCRDIEERETPF
jgi:hypothetical protein